MCPILIFTHAIIKTMRIQSLVRSIFSKNVATEDRWIATTLHQDHFSETDRFRKTILMYICSREIGTLAAANRFYEKNQFYGAPGIQILRRHWPPISTRHSITLQANRSTSHVIMKHCAATQEIHENYGRFVAGSAISMPNPAIRIFTENRNSGRARLDFHENPRNIH